MFSGVGIPKNNEDFKGISTDSNKYEGGVNQIEIPHARTRTPKQPLKEAGQSILRMELGKWMCIARAGRPEVIYDASASAQVFSDGEIIDILEEGGVEFWQTRKKRPEERIRRKISATCPAIPNLRGVCLWGGIGRIHQSECFGKG